eukprot:TCALIF_09515-PA protein Name:"Similar to Usb1 U6 snRNA phosphodiesterase (Rattus norvegicus)" AED:0.03 eAED:0.03 QI:0/0/0/0.5/1/1/2/0/260
MRQSENSECENSLKRPLTAASCASSELEPGSKIMKLPLPSVLFGPLEIPQDVQDDPNLHQGRIRSFPHVKGNWATYVYVSGLEGTLSDIELLQHDLQMVCAELPIKLEQIEDPHLSLSRVVTIKYDWIQPLMSSLKRSLAPFPRFKIKFMDIYILLNEEKTRTFICLGLDQSDRILRDLVSVIDANLAEFDLPAFYAQPKFHISLLWALGDQTLAFKARLPALRATFISWLDTLPSKDVQVSQLKSKSGNKIFMFPLGTS